ncbi:hypothetical protein SUNI508_00281 [Seiridium unicorne]|uniref:Uncharacterized protein n=1 Tax=Seiridium unicorne TaxID=138068 RepID=A0ABR2VIM4_9PEZI
MGRVFLWVLLIVVAVFQAVSDAYEGNPYRGLPQRRSDGPFQFHYVRSTNATGTESTPKAVGTGLLGTDIGLPPLLTNPIPGKIPGIVTGLLNGLIGY